MRLHSNLEILFWSLLVAFLACFASVRVIGLQPDAALYAGLARRIFVTQEYWALSAGEQMFAKFYEHPPYFFQWGAWLMSKMGISEGVAKTMGALPSFVGMSLLALFCYRVWGAAIAAWTIFILATTGHFTKYASTSMMEGPLALGVLMAALGSYVSVASSNNAIRLMAYLMTAMGIGLACAMKGVIGLGALGGAVLVFVGHIFVENKSLSRLLLVPFFAFFLLLAAASPFLFWLYQSVSSAEIMTWVRGYFLEQVLRSATTDRGEVFFNESNNYFYYLQVIVKNVWPWWWTVPVAFVWVFKSRKVIQEKSWVLWSLVASSYFLSFLIPLSLVNYKLPHYMHPTYMIMAPLGALVLYELCKKYVHNSVITSRWNFLLKSYLRWGVLILVGGLFFFLGSRVSTSNNRGQEFISVRSEISKLPLECRVMTPKEEMDPYRMTAYSLWYFEGRKWELIENRYPSAIAVPRDAVYWEPKSSRIWKGSRCL